MCCAFYPFYHFLVAIYIDCCSLVDSFFVLLEMFIAIFMLLFSDDFEVKSVDGGLECGSLNFLGFEGFESWEFEFDKIIHAAINRII